jgi:hypothetical protein
MIAGQFGLPDLRSTIAAAALAAALAFACSRFAPGVPPAAESGPPALASVDSFAANPTLILEADNDLPAPLAGAWKVATGERNCSLSLSIDKNDISGHTAGCSEAAEPRPIAIGLVSGSSFLFQTGRGGEGWIWSGRYNAKDHTLEGRREHVITGKLESFVARR